MFKLQRKDEMRRKPKFVSDENGLVVLEIGNDSKMKEFNMDVNSKIISVNNQYIECEKDIYEILKRNFHKEIVMV